MSFARLFNPFLLCAATLAVMVGSFAFLEEDGRVAASLVAMGVVAVFLPVAALFAPDWWRYALKMSAAALVFYICAMAVVVVSGAGRAMPPGAGFAFAIPVAAYCAAFQISGGIRFAVQLVRQGFGARRKRPFLGRSAKIALSAIVAFMVFAWLHDIALWALLQRQNKDQETARLEHSLNRN